MRKIKSLVLAVMGLLCCMSVSAHDFKVDGIYYNITSSTDKTVAVTYLGSNLDSSKYSGEVKIPESVTYNGKTYSVTSIGSYAFYKCSSLTSVELPNSVTSIDVHAFNSCSSLTSVEIGNSVTSIGYQAFYSCSSLTSVELPNSVTSIGVQAFSNCSSLTSVEIGNSVTSIGSYAFSNCSSLRTVINNSNLDITKGSTDYGYVAYNAYRVLSGENVNGFYFDEINGENVLTGHLSDELNLTLPESYNGQVYKIGDDAFRECSSLTSVEIPNSVTSIGGYAFYGCSSLTSVEIGNSVTSIGNYAFSNCSSLTSVELPNSVTSIGSYAFYDCSGLRSMTIGTGVLSIGSNQCTPKKVIWLTNTPPSGWSNLKGTINYVANTQYGSSSNVKVYQYLSSLFESDGVKYVPVSPSERTCDAIDCSYDSSVETINIGETVSYRGIAMTVLNMMPYLAYGQTSVKNVSISHKGSISNYAFTGCTGITNATIAHKGNIGNHAFYGCTGIIDATIANEGSIGESAFEGAMKTVNAVLNINSKGDIGSKAFYGCTGITNATIANEGSIGASAFEGAMITANAVLKVTSKGNINGKAFYGCTGIVNANLAIGEATEDNVATPMVFDDWTSTNTAHGSTSSKTYNFTVPATTTLTFNWSVSSESGYDYLYVILDGATLLSKSGSYSGTYANSIGQGDHTLVVKYSKDGISSSGQDQAKVYNIKAGGAIVYTAPGNIGTEAFRGCSSLSTLTLGENVTSIGERAFQGCVSLTAVQIPNRVTTLNDYCFSGTSSLENVNLGSGVQTIGLYCFDGCGIPSLSIPANVTQIGNYAFDNCTKLANVIIADRTTDLTLGSNGSSPLFSSCPLDSVYIGGNISYNTSSSFGYSPFYRNTSLRAVVITDKEEEISDNEFYGCTNLKNVTIGGDVKKIGKWAFSGCSNLDYFSFGKSVETIGQEAFSDCVNLKKLISYAEVPPVCGTNALDDINKWDCTLQVPGDCIAAYQQADQWKEFFFIEEVPTAIGGVTVDGAVLATADVYSANGMLVKRNADLKNLKHELPAGIYIIGGKKVYVR